MGRRPGGAPCAPTLEPGGTIPAEASGSWWAPRSSNSVLAVQSDSQAYLTLVLLV